MVTALEPVQTTAAVARVRCAFQPMFRSRQQSYGNGQALDPGFARRHSRARCPELERPHVAVVIAALRAGRNDDPDPVRHPGLACGRPYRHPQGLRQSCWSQELT